MSKKYKVGVFGSAAGDYQTYLPIAQELGRLLGEHADSVIVVTGACSGLPYAAAQAAAAKGGEIWGFSSSQDEAGQHAEYPDDDLSIYKKLVYISPGFSFADSKRACQKYRNMIATATCDAGIIVCGRWGAHSTSSPTLLICKKSSACLRAVVALPMNCLPWPKKSPRRAKGRLSLVEIRGA